MKTERCGYYGTIDYAEFYNYLDNLNPRGIRYALSFDGIRGDKEYKTGIPKELYVKKFLLPSGNSSFKKVMDKSNEQVYEALYLNW
jgi:DNA adenine methylase